MQHKKNIRENLQNSSSLLGEVNTFEKIVVQLNSILLSKIDALEINQQTTEQSSEKQLKELTGLFKLLQGVEEMLKHIQEKKDKNRDSGIDAVEFRRKLEKQIAQLVDEEVEGKLS